MYIREDYLRDLDDLSIDNLALGRITKNAISLAARIAKENSNFLISDVGLSAHIVTTSEWILADVLNDMMEAAKHKQTNPKG